MPRKIILAGEGGQGIQTVAKIIALAAIKSGKNVTFLPSFGVEQRGGVSIVFLQISDKPILYPRFAKANILVAFSSRAISPLKKFLEENSLFIYDNSVVENKFLEKIKGQIKNYLAIPAQKIGRERFTTKVVNMVMLGGMAANLKEINFQEFENALLEELAEKIKEKPEIKDLNLGAFKAGLEEVEKFDQETQPLEGVAPASFKCFFEKENLSWERFPEYCKGCGLCLLKCPVKCLSFEKENVGFLGMPLPTVEIEKCLGCKQCMEICPEGAIRVEKQ